MIKCFSYAILFVFIAFSCSQSPRIELKIREKNNIYSSLSDGIKSHTKSSNVSFHLTENETNIIIEYDKRVNDYPYLLLTYPILKTINNEYKIKGLKEDSIKFYFIEKDTVMIPYSFEDFNELDGIYRVTNSFEEKYKRKDMNGMLNMCSDSSKSDLSESFENMINDREFLTVGNFNKLGCFFTEKRIYLYNAVQSTNKEYLVFGYTISRNKYEIIDIGVNDFSKIR